MMGLRETGMANGNKIAAFWKELRQRASRVRMTVALWVTNAVCAVFGFIIAGSWRFADQMILGYAPDGVPFWVYGIGGVLIAAAAVLFVLAFAGKKNKVSAETEANESDDLD